MVTTGIFKESVDEPPMLRKLNMDEDRQTDLTVHGGEDKAIYTYPKEDSTTDFTIQQTKIGSYIL